MKKIFLWISLLLFMVLSLVFEQPFVEKYDIAVILFFEGIRTEFLNSLFYLFTEVGSIKILLPVAIVVSLLLVVKKQYREAFFVMLAFWEARWINHLLKELFERERPSFNSLIEAGSYSFPSGHAMNSTVFLGFLFYLFIHILQLGKRYSLMWLLTVIATVILIAISRVYLGVHYLTDIIAGGCAGLVVLFFTIYLYERSAKIIIGKSE